MARKPRSVIEARPIDVSERMRMPYGRLLIPEDGGYRAEILEFPGCFAEGDDASEALFALEEAAESWLEAAIEMGSPIPRPLDESEFSGKLVVRLPKSLHRKASIAAERDGVSLNQFIVGSLAECIGSRPLSREPAAHLICNFHVMTTYQPSGGSITATNSLDWQPAQPFPFKNPSRELVDANR